MSEIMYYNLVIEYKIERDVNHLKDTILLCYIASNYFKIKTLEKVLDRFRLQGNKIQIIVEYIYLSFHRVRSCTLWKDEDKPIIKNEKSLKQKMLIRKYYDGIHLTEAYSKLSCKSKEKLFTFVQDNHLKIYFLEKVIRKYVDVLTMSQIIIDYILDSYNRVFEPKYNAIFIEEQNEYI